jgi:CRISPR system Cascade subunit CasA
MLNLMKDPWIPVVRRDGSRATIAPWEIADSSVLDIDWPRPDLNIACLEFLIGMVFLCDPPSDIEDWSDRCDPDPERLRDRMLAFAPAFDLLGDGPRFLQDLDDLRLMDLEESPVDMLFIDSAGEATIRKNADLMVRRGRYPSLPLPMAAMALYTLQAFAPSGGAGHRTSMRGGGPMVTIVDPRKGVAGSLWDLIWANVPYGQPGSTGDLPWMRPTVTSEEGRKIHPDDARLHPECFFGMPRRIRLIDDGEEVTGVLQKNYGGNYSQWIHPLSAYYRVKEDSEWLPRLAKPGAIGFRGWLGVLVRKTGDTRQRLAFCIEAWGARGGDADVIVAGWAMNNMSPIEFTHSRQPLLPLLPEEQDVIVGFVRAADASGSVLREALQSGMGAGAVVAAQQERFFMDLESDFLSTLRSFREDPVSPEKWLNILRSTAVRIFDACCTCGIDGMDAVKAKSVMRARAGLFEAFAGRGKHGARLHEDLGIKTGGK